MKRLWIAIGNPLRGDDGVAARAVELASPGPGIEVRHELQLAPELAPVIAGADEVIFVDAAVDAPVSLTEVKAEAGRGWSHHLSAGMVTAMARELYGFGGQAWLCAVPAFEFGAGARLSERAEAAAVEAANLLNRR